MHVIFKLILIFRLALNVFTFPPFIDEKERKRERESEKEKETKSEKKNEMTEKDTHLNSLTVQHHKQLD